MNHRVVFSPRAVVDLEREADAVALLNPRAAERRARDDLAQRLRMTIVRDWLIFYRAGDEEVRIERILYGPRDIRPRDFG